MRRAGPALAAAALAAALGSGCGSDDFPNEPRAPAPIEVTASVDNRAVRVSPDEFGAGLVNFTVTNLSDSPARFVLEGDNVDAATADIEAGAVTTLKVALEQGNYQATGGPRSDAKPDRIDVGPTRPNATNDLLQP